MTTYGCSSGLSKKPLNHVLPGTAGYSLTCTSSLQSALETLKNLVHETDVWFEIADFLVPEESDSEAEIEKMTQWLMENLGPEVPSHFSAFHLDWKMMGKPRTPLSILTRSRATALKNELGHIYTGNVHYIEGESTYCRSIAALFMGGTGTNYLPGPRATRATAGPVASIAPGFSTARPVTGTASVSRCAWGMTRFRQTAKGVVPHFVATARPRYVKKTIGPGP